MEICIGTPEEGNTMKRIILPLIIIASLLAGCSLPTSKSNPTPSNNDLETQVSQLLTNVPSTQSAPAALPTAGVTVIPTQVAQPPQPTVTPLPTVTSEPTSAPTQAEAQTQAPTPAATVTQAPTTAATSAGTAQPTAVPSAGDPLSKLGTPTWQDKFTDNTNWPSGVGKFTSISVGSNKLQITGLSDLDGWRLTFPKVADFYMESTFQTGTCSGSDRYGMIVRVPDLTTANSGYLIGLTCDGKYSLRKWDGTTMFELIPWTSSSTIQSGANQTNRLGVLANGSKLTVYINGTAMKSATDSAFSTGYFGVWVGANTTPQLTITATQIAYWENPNL
jgi:hypothetical protein